MPLLANTILQLARLATSGPPRTVDALRELTGSYLRARDFQKVSHAEPPPELFDDLVGGTRGVEV